MTPEEKETILSFLCKTPMGVISTIHENGAPESALVAFAETADLEIIFQTFNDARKYTNLMRDARIAVVVGCDLEKEMQMTFQYEGVAKECKSESNEYVRYRTIFENKGTPATNKFLDNPKSCTFVVTPTWFRYSDYSQEIPNIIEYASDSIF